MEGSSHGWGKERYHRQSYASTEIDGHPRKHQLEAAHMMDGETQFPTAMSYISDAQQSDVATVCSGSVVEDIEVESVVSQEDSHSHGHSQTHNYLQAPPPPQSTVVDRTLAGGGTIRRTASGGRVVEFSNAPAPAQQDGSDRRFSATDAAAVKSVVLAPAIGTIDVASGFMDTKLPASLHDMGPPLSRSLLSQRSMEDLPSGPGSVRSSGSEGALHMHSDDGGGLADTEAQSIHSYDDRARNPPPRSEALPVVSQPALHKPKELFPRPSSVKSFGSQAGSDTATQVDMDDCGGSLDVETHSIETRSIHSQEEAHPSEPPSTYTVAKPTESEKPQLAQNSNFSLVETASDKNGRRSPGGTIYKGKGTRRYKGRYMHLPLKRFHQNGVDLESVHEDRAAIEPRLTVGYLARTDHQERSDRCDGFRLPGSRRCRSRSRSRSPGLDRDVRRIARQDVGSSSSHKVRRRHSRSDSPKPLEAAQSPSCGVVLVDRVSSRIKRLDRDRQNRFCVQDRGPNAPLMGQFYDEHEPRYGEDQPRNRLHQRKHDRSNHKNRRGEN